MCSLVSGAYALIFLVLHQLAASGVMSCDVGNVLLIQGIRLAKEVIIQRGVAVLTHQEVHQFIRSRLGRAQLEGITPFGGAPEIKAV